QLHRLDLRLDARPRASRQARRQCGARHVRPHFGKSLRRHGRSRLHDQGSCSVDRARAKVADDRRLPRQGRRESEEGDELARFVWRGVKRMRPWQVAGVCVGVGAFALFIFLNNTSLLAPAPTGKPFLLAHRGISQTFPTQDVKNDTCTARLIYPPTNPYLENTMASMRASFRAGADIVEFDVHPTTDGQFAVFHDW